MSWVNLFSTFQPTSVKLRDYHKVSSNSYLIWEKQNKKQIWSELQLWALFLIHMFSKPVILQLREVSERP